MARLLAGMALALGHFLLEPAIPRARDAKAMECHGAEEAQGTHCRLAMGWLHGVEWRGVAYL